MMRAQIKEVPDGFILLQRKNGKPCRAACMTGKFAGWLMYKHPDGQWVSERKLEGWEIMQAEDQRDEGIVHETGAAPVHDAAAPSAELTEKEQAALARFDKPEWRAASHLQLRAWLSIEHGHSIRLSAQIENLQDEVSAGAAVYAAPTHDPAAPSTEQAEAFALYRAVNEMMAHLGAHGEINARHELADRVMAELHNLDGGNVAQRIEDLIEKAFMPRDQATRLALSEYCTCNEPPAAKSEQADIIKLAGAAGFNVIGGGFVTPKHASHITDELQKFAGLLADSVLASAAGAGNEQAPNSYYTFKKPHGWINLGNPGQTWEQWTRTQGIPTTRGWKVSGYPTASEVGVSQQAGEHAGELADERALEVVKQSRDVLAHALALAQDRIERLKRELSAALAQQGAAQARSASASDEKCAACNGRGYLLPLGTEAVDSCRACKSTGRTPAPTQAAPLEAQAGAEKGEA